jgi:hypothetical protein
MKRDGHRRKRVRSKGLTKSITVNGQKTIWWIGQNVAGGRAHVTPYITIHVGRADPKIDRGMVIGSPVK